MQNRLLAHHEELFDRIAGLSDNGSVLISIVSIIGRVNGMAGMSVTLNKWGNEPVPVPESGRLSGTGTHTGTGTGFQVRSGLSRSCG